MLQCGPRPWRAFFDSARDLDGAGGLNTPRLVFEGFGAGAVVMAALSLRNYGPQQCSMGSSRLGYSATREPRIGENQAHQVRL